jgi:hypothetical protein
MDSYITQLNADLQEQQVWIDWRFSFVLPLAPLFLQCGTLHVWQNDPMFRQRAFVTDEDIRGIPSFRDQVCVCADTHPGRLVSLTFQGLSLVELIYHRRSFCRLLSRSRRHLELLWLFHTQTSLSRLIGGNIRSF